MAKPLRNAVELDEYLSNLTEEERAFIGESIPTGWQDQVDAASAQAVAAEEERLGHKAVLVGRHGIIDWMRLGMYDVVLKWFHGDVLLCPHQPSPKNPEPVFAAAWKPGIVVCDFCLPLLNVTGIADATCDGCGHVCEGPPDDGITPVTSFSRSLGYQVGVCDTCHEEMKRVEAESPPE